MAKDNQKEGEEGQNSKMRPCPQCKKLAVEKYYPFCSKRCADIDLSKWFNGSYAIPAAEEDPSAEHFDRDL